MLLFSWLKAKEIRLPEVRTFLGNLKLFVERKLYPCAELKILHEDVWGSKAIAPNILKLGVSRREWVGVFTLRLLYRDFRLNLDTWVGHCSLSDTYSIYSNERYSRETCSIRILYRVFEKSVCRSSCLHRASIVSKALFIIPTDANYYKSVEMLKQFKVITIAPICFGSSRNHHQGAVLCLAETTDMFFFCVRRYGLSQCYAWTEACGDKCYNFKLF
jgi:hypothetical protein